MENKKSLLQDSLQELENIKNESLELAKEQLINESADLLEKKSAELFEKLISEGEEESKEPEKEDDDSEEELETEPSDEKDDEEGEDEEGEEENDEEDEENDDDITFDDEDDEDEEGDDEDFMSVKVDEKVLKEAKSSYNKEVDAYKFFIVDLKKKKAISGWEFQSDAKDALSDYDKDPNFKVVAERTLSSMGIKNPKEDFKNPKKINENINMKNNRKEVIKDLRDISFNKLVEAYYNMDEADSFVIDEESLNEYDYEDDYIDIEDDPEFSKRMSGSKQYKPSSRDLKSMKHDDDEYDPYADVRKGGDDYGDEEMDEEIMYEIEMPEGDMYEEELTDEEINKMLGEMDLDEEVPPSEQGSAYKTQEKHRHFKGDIHSYHKDQHTDELEEMFQDMTMEELMEMEEMLENEPQMTSEAEVEDNIEEMLDEMKSEEEGEDEIEESMRLSLSQANKHQMPKRVRNLSEEEDMQEVASLHKKVKQLEKEKANLQEGFANKVKLLENKVYDVTISALKAGFVNKFLLENPLRENEKTEIVYRFANAQTKEQIKETYISLTNEFAKRQIVKDGSMLNESVQNKVGKIHRTDNAIVREKNLINENDETNRFKQLLNYNFGKK
jgi:hypothetical protein